MTNKDLTQGGNFAILPGFIRYDKTLTDSEKMLYAEVTALSNRHGYCYASNQYFSELYGVTTVTVSRRIKSLEKKGYLKIDYVRHGASIKSRNIFPLTTDITAINTNDNGDYQEKQRPLTEEATAINRNVKDNNLSINKLSINKLNTNKEKEKENVLFEKWWKSYPKKNASKQEVKTKFIKAVKEIGEEKLFEHTSIYLETQDNIKYICNPAKFFNQKYYSEDALETNKQILKENGGIKNNSEYYELNKEALAEEAAKREADAEFGNLPF